MSEYDIDAIDDAYTAGYDDAENALRPLIAAADELAVGVLEADSVEASLRWKAQVVRDLTTPKGDTP